MKQFFLLGGFLTIGLAGFSQNWHVTSKFGLGSYKGDLKPTGGLKQSRMGWSLGARYDLTEHFIGRLLYNRTRLQATSNSTGNLQNLNFQAKLNEVELGIQYQIFSLNEKWWTPYVVLGASVFGAKPYTMYNGNKVFLQPLGTAGQGYVPGRDTYKTTQIAFVYGLGAEYAISEDVRVGLEASFRYTNTDYLDDVSMPFVDPNAILTNSGATALALAYRGNGTYPAGISPARGSNITKDKFYFISLTLTVRPFVNQWERTSGLASMKKGKKVGCPQSKGIF